MRSVVRGICVIAALALLAGFLGAGPALANEAHPFKLSFERSTGVPFSNPNGIAVEEATGDVYVADLGSESVYKYDAEGKPVEFSALHSAALAGTSTESFSFPASANGTPAAIAVDNSGNPTDPSAGDLYVLDAGHQVIDKFAPTGAYLGQVTNLGQLQLVDEGNLSEAEIVGLGVDPNGNLRVELVGGRESESLIATFDDSDPNDFVTLRALVKSLRARQEDGFAVDAAGDGYVLGAECGCVQKFSPNGESLGEVDDGSPDVAVAVDQATGHVYIDDQTYVDEWDAGEMNGTFQGEIGEVSSPGSLLSPSFGSTPLGGNSSGQGGIAVDARTGEVYVSNPQEGKVDVFSTSVPAVAAGEAGGVTQSTATLNGSVDPRGEAIARCEFEYGATNGFAPVPNASYEAKAPCAQTPAGMSPVPVSADIKGLKAGLLYHFRLTIENGSGASFSTGLFATSGPGFGVKPGSFGVSFLEANGTPDTQAGSHPYEMSTSIAFNTTVVPAKANDHSAWVTVANGSVKDITTNLPPGLFADPNATPKKCALHDISNGLAGVCPAESEVGYLEVEYDSAGETSTDSAETLKEPVYNMVPPAGVAIQFGAHLLEANAYIDVGVQAGGAYGGRATVVDTSALVSVVRTRLVIFGTPPHGATKPLLTLPTACNGPLSSGVDADSYQHPGQFSYESALTLNAAGTPGGMSGCSHLIFPPTIGVTPDTTDTSTSSGLTVDVNVPQTAAFNPNGLAESSLRDTTVTLPEGVTLNPSGANNLEACTSNENALGDALGSPGDQIGYTGQHELNQYEPGVKWSTFSSELPSPLDPGANFCPNGSKIGTVKIKTPLLEHELEGAVYLATQEANPFGSLVAMYMVAEDPVSGTLIKFAGEVSLTPTGQIVTTFKNTPDLPFETLELHFFGGERAPLSTPSRCGSYTTEAVFTPWDGNGPVHKSSTFEIDHGPNGGPCPGASLPFNPSLTAGTTSIQAGGFSPFTMTMSREDGQQNLQSVSLKMPPGLSGLLTGVELCGEAQANAGTCGPNSLIGETIVSVGIGNDPFSVKGGKVYLTGPYKGAPFGLSIVNPAKAGPFDLESTAANHPACDCLVVRAKIEVDPVTADLTVTSDNEGPYKIPSIIDGIPLQIKHVNVTIGRPGFTFNPTNCSSMAITGALDSTEGATDALSVPFQATNCARLSFKPQLDASTSGKTSRANGASLHVKLSYPKAPQGTQSNIKSVRVELPKALPSRLSTLNHACLDSVFDQNPASCPSQSRVGFAKAVTPVLPVPLEGPAYFVSHGGQKFPELIVVLQGYGVTVYLKGETFISKTGITSSTFKTVPDVPVGSFELTLPQGPSSALAANTDLCSTNLTMPTAFHAQNGATLNQKTAIEVQGCPYALRIAHHAIEKRTLTLKVSVPQAGRLVANGKGVSKGVKTAKGRSTLTLTLKEDHVGKQRTKILLRFTPTNGKQRRVLRKSITVTFH